jgi:hypothetical protein
MLAAFPDLASGDLHIAVSMPAPETLVLKWTGRSMRREPGEALMPFLRQALELAADKGGLLEMHFEALEQVNSSTIGVLIRLIRAARDRKVPMAICFDQGCKWQELSFEALRVFAVSGSSLELRPVVPPPE